MQFLIAFGNAMGRNSYYRVGDTRHHTNLFVALVGDSAKSRKGTSYDLIKSLMKQADPEWAENCIRSGLSSGEGIIHAVHDDIMEWAQVPGTGKKGVPAEHAKAVKEPGVEDKRLLIVEHEFFNVLTVMKRPGNTLSPVMRNAWDGGHRLETMTKNNQETATDAHVSNLAHVTKEELCSQIDMVSISNGFANRYLFPVVHRSKELPFPGQLDPSVAEYFAKTLNDRLNNNAVRNEITFHSATRELWKAEYHGLSAGRDGLLGSILARAEAQTLRLAMIYALADGMRQIHPEHLRAGIAVWRFCDASATYIFGDLIGDPVADTILRALRQPGTDGMTRSEISDLFGRNKSSGEISRALETLLKQRKATMTRRGGGYGQGRPVETWFAA